MCMIYRPLEPYELTTQSIDGEWVGNVCMVWMKTQTTSGKNFKPSAVKESPNQKMCDLWLHG